MSALHSFLRLLLGVASVACIVIALSGACDWVAEHLFLRAAGVLLACAGVAFALAVAEAAGDGENPGERRKGGRPRKGNVAFKLCIRPSTLVAIGRIAAAAGMDRNVWVEQVVVAEFARIIAAKKGGAQ